MDQTMKKIAAESADGTPLKYDEGKLDLTLVEPWLIESICRVYEYGAKSKYGRESWKQFSHEDAMKLMAPALRHIHAYRKGEFTDPESGLPHLMQAVWNLSTIFFHEINKKD